MNDPTPLSQYAVRLFTTKVKQLQKATDGQTCNKCVRMCVCVCVCCVMDQAA